MLVNKVHGSSVQVDGCNARVETRSGLARIAMKTTTFKVISTSTEIGAKGLDLLYDIYEIIRWGSIGNQHIETHPWHDCSNRLRLWPGPPWRWRPSSTVGVHTAGTSARIE